jgi:hypothetical protein
LKVVSAALVTIAAAPCERGTPVRGSFKARREVDRVWPPAKTVVLSWFDFGFDDRDLDAEDSMPDLEPAIKEGAVHSRGDDRWAQ